MTQSLEAAARALLAKLHAAGKAIDFAIQIATLHHFPYTGPTYGEEMGALEAALDALPAESVPHLPRLQLGPLHDAYDALSNDDKSDPEWVEFLAEVKRVLDADLAQLDIIGDALDRASPPSPDRTQEQEREA
jgi:hypothetical protein